MKPHRLYPGDSIAIISPSWGCAGAPDVKWRYLGSKGYLKQLNGIVIGKMCIQNHTLPHSDTIRQIVSVEYECPQLPIIYGLNFGHASPICTLPYGAHARMDIDNLRFFILDSGVT